MLFLIISTPLPGRPSEVREQRQKIWPWMTDLLDRGIARSFLLRTGRGATVVFDVDSHETLHRLLTEWSEAVPCEFGIYPVMEPESAKAFLDEYRAD